MKEKVMHSRKDPFAKYTSCHSFLPLILMVCDLPVPRLVRIVYLACTAFPASVFFSVLSGCCSLNRVGRNIYIFH